jgi:hypothetical protein
MLMKMIYNSGLVKTGWSVVHDIILLSQEAEDQVAEAGHGQDPTFYNNLFEYATRSMMEENDEFREMSDGDEVVCRSVVRINEAFTIGMVGIIRVSGIDDTPLLQRYFYIVDAEDTYKIAERLMKDPSELRRYAAETGFFIIQ